MNFKFQMSINNERKEKLCRQPQTQAAKNYSRLLAWKETLMEIKRFLYQKRVSEKAKPYAISLFSPSHNKIKLTKATRKRNNNGLKQKKRQKRRAKWKENCQKLGKQICRQRPKRDLTTTGQIASDMTLIWLQPQWHIQEQGYTQTLHLVQYSHLTVKINPRFKDEKIERRSCDDEEDFERR